MRIVGLVISSAAGRVWATDSSRKSFDFCSVDRPLCMGWRVLAFRYAVAKARYESGLCGIAGMRLNAGKRRAVVVDGVGLDGREEAVMRTLWNG